MQEPHSEGVATHTDPESCGVHRKVKAEALTGARTGRVLSLERERLRDADAVGGCGRQYRTHREREMRPGPAGSETPGMYGNTTLENREVLCPPAADKAAGRAGKSKDARRR